MADDDEQVGKNAESEDGVEFQPTLSQPTAEECHAGPEELSVGPEQLSAPAHETTYEVHAETDEAFLLEELATPMADDGMPDHSGDAFQGGTHPFTVEHVVCVEDHQALVSLFEDEVLLGCHHSKWFDHESRVRALRPFNHAAAIVAVVSPARFNADGTERAREEYDPSLERELWGFSTHGEPRLDCGPRFAVGLVEIGTLSDDLRKRMEAAHPNKIVDPRLFVAVRHRRPRCVHYKRQIFANDEQMDPELPSHRIFFRNCTHPARRSIGGASLGLQNEAIYACDYRSPQDPDSVALIDRADRKKLDERPDLIRLPLFNLGGDEVHLGKDDDERA